MVKRMPPGFCASAGRQTRTNIMEANRNARRGRVLWCRRPDTEITKRREIREISAAPVEVDGKADRGHNSNILWVRDETIFNSDVVESCLSRAGGPFQARERCPLACRGQDSTGNGNPNGNRSSAAISG